MGRLGADLTAKLPAMKEARKGVAPGQIVQGTKLAEMAGITWRILKQRILSDPDFPVKERGADGRPWTFDAAQALDHLIARSVALKTKRSRRASESARLAGFASPVEAGGPTNSEPGGEDDGPVHGEAADLAAHARALKALAEAQMLTHRLKVQQGEYVRADAVTTLLMDLMTTMQVETLGISAKLDPAGKWPVDLRASVESELRNALVHVRAKLDKVVVNGRVRLA